MKNIRGSEKEADNDMRETLMDIAAVGAIIATDKAMVSIILKLSFF
ncbi:hypothetical protein DFN09_003365 [Clostridium acetobutylicum]|nr:hypothetical protein [Clostridium acetobutylicum]